MNRLPESSCLDDGGTTLHVVRPDAERRTTSNVAERRATSNVAERRATSNVAERQATPNEAERTANSNDAERRSTACCDAERISISNDAERRSTKSSDAERQSIRWAALISFAALVFAVTGRILGGTTLRVVRPDAERRTTSNVAERQANSNDAERTANLNDAERRSTACCDAERISISNDAERRSTKDFRAKRWPVRWLALISFSALLFAIIARIEGPSDIWDRSQPKTISYTTDIIVNGGNRWILPMERAVEPATKPPLYNWIAVPFVKLLGFNSELAHKFPSIIALCLTWLAIVRLGRRIDPQADQSLGWIAGMMVVANHTMFKLGYLARPDMLLTLWLTLAWMAVTHVLVQGRNTPAMNSHPPHEQATIKRSALNLTAMSFWLCAALAGLTKGPAALIAIVYAIVAARMIGGSWREFRSLQPLIGLPLFLLINGAWIYGVWRINPEHLTQTLIGDELFGRVTGTMAEQDLHGWRGWVMTMPHYVLYYFVRFLPWSVISVAAIIMLWRTRFLCHSGEVRRDALDQPRAASLPPLRQWLLGAGLQIVLIIGFFTLSTGKRADYIAAAFVPGALLAAWWLLRAPPLLAQRYPILTPGMAAITLLVVTIINQRQPSAPFPEYGRYMSQFIDETSEILARDRLPVAFCFTGKTHVQAMLGYSVRDDSVRLDRLMRTGRPFWVVAGRRGPYRDFPQWLRERTGLSLRIKAHAHSAPLTWRGGMMEQFTLYRVSVLREGVRG